MEEVLDEEVLESIRVERVQFRGTDEDADVFDEVHQKLASARAEIGRCSGRVACLNVLDHLTT